MTLTYTLEVSKARLCGFAKLLARWRGSIYKLMYKEMILFAVLYYALALFYRLCLSERRQRSFEQVAVYCREFTNLIPITFVMGFYVWIVVDRWWKQYLSIPWPDKVAIQVAAYVQGADERGRLLRRSLVRYLNLMFVFTFQAASPVIRRRFPTTDHIVEAGLMTIEERNELAATVTPHGSWWVPANWFSQLAMVARKEGRIHDDLHLKSLIDEMLEYRSHCGMIWNYDWISVPLVYTQVVTLAVYSFFVACLMGRQYLYNYPENYPNSQFSHSVDFYVPVFTLFQFFFYMGWLKVAELMICPFGEDDDDFELNWILDRNVQMSLMTVDTMYRRHPKLTHDQFWDELDFDIPYTEAAAGYKTNPFMGSTMSMNLNHKDMEWHVPSVIAEEDVIDGLLLPPDTDQLDIGSRQQLAADLEIGALPNHRRLSGARHSKNSERNSGNESPSTVTKRPKFLHVLLAGDSRLSLASRFGSKGSVGSSRSRQNSRVKSPTMKRPLAGTLFNRQRSTPMPSTSVQQQVLAAGHRRMPMSAVSRYNSYHHRVSDGSWAGRRGAGDEIDGGIRSQAPSTTNDSIHKLSLLTLDDDASRMYPPPTSDQASTAFDSTNRLNVGLAAESDVASPTSDNNNEQGATSDDGNLTSDQPTTSNSPKGEDKPMSIVAADGGHESPIEPKEKLVRRGHSGGNGHEMEVPPVIAEESESTLTINVGSVACLTGAATTTSSESSSNGAATADSGNETFDNTDSRSKLLPIVVE